MRTKALFVALFFACSSAVAVGAMPHVSSAITNCSADNSIDSEGLALLNLINNYREQNGLGSLALSGTLNRAAAWKSNDMAVNAYFAHDDTSIGRSWYVRLRDCGYDYNTWTGENIAAGIPDAATAFSLWQHSPGHNANMLGQYYTTIGIGRVNVAGSPYGWYWTTDFGGYFDDDSGGATSVPTETPTPTDTATPTATRTMMRTPIRTPAATSLGLRGDVNCDHAVGVIDASLILQVDAGIIHALTCGQNADLNHDGRVGVLDALLVLQYAAVIPRL